MKTHNFENSSSIVSCTHDHDKNVMHITFTSGKTYSYGDCSHGDFEAMTKAESPGKHFSRHIRTMKGLYRE